MLLLLLAWLYVLTTWLTRLLGFVRAMDWGLRMVVSASTCTSRTRAWVCALTLRCCTALALSLTVRVSASRLLVPTSSSLTALVPVVECSAC